MELPSNTLLQNGKYKIIKKIGQGGFGIAYKAYQQGLQREVCIKEFFFYDLCERARNSSNITIISTSPEKIQLVATFKRKFLKEANRLKQFQHPNIVSVLDSFEENNTAYFVMEYLEGGSLEDLLDREDKLSEQKTIEIILPIINAMETVHKADLLHLDIKPANIMLRKDQTPVLIDFGISKYMEIAAGYTTTAPVGISKGYAPLEQYGGNVKDFTKATDIYSICATIYRMVTGVIPPEPLQFIGGKLKSPIEYNSQLSAEFNNAIIKGMSIAAIDRQQIMSDLIRLLVVEKDILVRVPILSEIELFKYDDAQSFSEGLAKIKLKGKYGFIDKTGKEIISCKYDNSESFSEGLAVVGLNKERGWGFIDKIGQEVIQCKYEHVKSFSEGMAAVKLNGKYGFIDKIGSQVISCKYDSVESFKEGFAAFLIRGVKWGFINKNGHDITLNNYNYVTEFSEGFAAVKLLEKWGFIDISGRQIISCNFDEVKSFSEGLAMIKLNNKYGFIDKFGKEVITCKYDSANSFSEGLAMINLNGKYGFIDKIGKEVIPCKYNVVESFNDGLAKVTLNGEYLIFRGQFGGWLKGEWGFIDKTGREVIPFKYYDTSSFKDGLAPVRLSKEGKVGFINKIGNEVILRKYDFVQTFSEGFAAVNINEKWGFIDKTGKVII